MRLAIPLMALGLALIIAASAALLIRSCGVRLPFANSVISACPSDAAIITEERLALLEQQRQELRRNIGFLERELAGRQCFAEAPAIPAPAPPSGDGFDPEAFNDRDIAVLEGCWALDTDYTLYSRQTGDPVYFEDWQMCFDGRGNGTQTFQTTSGMRCEGEAKGTFDGSGSLLIDDLRDVPCTMQSKIIRRITTCTIDTVGNATCGSTEYDNRTGHTSAVGLRRID